MVRRNVEQTQRTTMLVGVKWSVATTPLKKPAMSIKTMFSPNNIAN
jgi:hypothetical protein